MDFYNHRRERINVARFTKEGEEGEQQMSRIQFSREIIQEGMGFAPTDINCLVKLPGKKEEFDVSFRTSHLLDLCHWKYIQENKQGIWAGFRITILSDAQYKMTTIQFFSETVSDEDVDTWLRRHYGLLKRVWKIWDEDVIWGGAWKCQIRLRMDPQIKGKVCHLPNTIQIGENRGMIFFERMPRLCRRSQAGDHVIANCTAVICNNCRGQHKTQGCTGEIRCNLCGTDGHTFRTCPKSYANKMKQALVEQAESDQE
ncbi:ZCHC3 protein, partial [Amia calva]|nr:ZCHC3 protein [Amia calva]MBN3303747.1 ZCHC3 protein [Amia calva]